MGNSYLPSSDQGLLNWSANFAVKLVPGTDGLTAPQVIAYGVTQAAYAAALANANAPATRTAVTIALKDAAKNTLLDLTRLDVSIVEGQAALTDAHRIELGLNVRKAPAPIPVPAEAPVIDQIAMRGHTLSLRLHDENSTRRGKPEGVSGASVFSYVGENPPADIAQWTFRLSTGRTNVELDFDSALAPGAKVWVTAFWFNPRNQPGPTAAAQSALIQFGAPSMEMAAQELKDQLHQAA